MKKIWYPVYSYRCISGEAFISYWANNLTPEVRRERPEGDG